MFALEPREQAKRFLDRRAMEPARDIGVRREQHHRDQTRQKQWENHLSPLSP